jgi:hypothetical protein
VVRAQALRALGRLGGDADVPLLVQAMADPNPWPSLYAARGARDAGGRQVLVDLIARGQATGVLAGQVLNEEASE